MSGVAAGGIAGKRALHDDVFRCTADPGWVTGTSYGIIAPLTNGVTSIVDEAEFDAERWYGVLEAHRVTEPLPAWKPQPLVWGGSPDLA